MYMEKLPFLAFVSCFMVQMFVWDVEGQPDLVIQGSSHI